MANKYVDFISDEHLLMCIQNLHNAYLKAKNNVSKRTFYKNKVDTIKLTFDSLFNDISEEDLIQAEILRQIDKSINNSIGTFHEQVLGGVEGYEVGNFSGFDIKAKDDSLFAVFGKSDLKKNISDSIFHKLANEARIFKSANFYYVLADDFSELYEKWVIGNEEYKISQKQVFIISIKQFYTKVTDNQNAFDNLMQSLTEIKENQIITQLPS